ncbi:MAG TPA: hypothetical protein VMX94_11625 [Armatimonadota bacterium]|nr:hypothetical protein [Armatimonadota bacterium]
MLIGSALQAILSAFMVNVLLKIVIAGVVAPIIICTSVYPKPTAKAVLQATLMIAVGGSLAFQLLVRFPGGLVGILVGLVAFWFVTSLTLDHCFDVDFDKSYSFTGTIVVATALIWLVVGAVIYILGAVK